MKKMGLYWPLDILPYVGLEWGFVEIGWYGIVIEVEEEVEVEIECRCW